MEPKVEKRVEEMAEAMRISKEDTVKRSVALLSFVHRHISDGFSLVLEKSGTETIEVKF